DSITVKDVDVNFTLEEWALLDHSQKNLYREVRMENFWNMVFVGIIQDDHNIGNEYRNPRRNLRKRLG
uniref:KRAB domain-containing protein n=1 Tax=Oryctolagus cuniculus TaxID=9986 RepID=A0A5F9CK23_RABIT